MNSLLLKNRPKDLDEEGFRKTYENSSYILEALYKTIKELVPSSVIKGNDFELGNHYGKLVWQLGQQDFAEKVLDLFPSKLKTP